MPALPVVLGWMAGILLWHYGIPWGAVASALAIGLGLIFIRKFFPSFVFLALACGWIVATASAPVDAPEGVFDGEERLYSMTVKNVKNSPSSMTLIAEIDSLGMNEGHLTPTAAFTVRLTSLPEWIPPAIGERLLVRTVLEPVDVGTLFPHQRDLSLYNIKNGIVAQAFIEGDPIESQGPGEGLAAWLASRRDAAVSLLAHTSLSDKAYGLLAALLTGYGDELDASMREGFRTTGIAHILALSGFHVGVIVMLVSLVLFPLAAWPRLRRWRIALSVAFVWAYAAFIGMPESVVRAAVMLTVLSLGRVFGRESNPYNSLCVAVLVILAVWPFSLFSAGLQLSVCAVLGILTFAEKLNPFNPRRRKLYVPAMYVTVPVAAILGTLPVTVYTFHYLPAFFLPGNLFISMLLPVLMIGGLLILALAAMGIGWAWPCGVMNGLVDFVDRVVGSIASLPGAQIEVFPTGVQTVLLALGLALLGIFAYATSRRWRIGLLASTLAVLACVPAFPEDIPTDEVFIVNMSGATPIVARHGNDAYVVATCHPDRLDHLRRRLGDELEPYAKSRGLDSLKLTYGDFVLPQFSRQGSVLNLRGKRVALLWKGSNPDSLAAKADYAIICSRYRGSAADAVAATGADTLILSRDISLKRLKSLKADSPVPVIDLRNP